MVENANHGRITKLSKSSTLSFDILAHTLSGRVEERRATTAIAVAQISYVSETQKMKSLYKNLRHKKLHLDKK